MEKKINRKESNEPSPIEEKKITIFKIDIKLNNY